MRADPRLRIRKDLKCPKCKSDDIEIPMHNWGYKIEIVCNACKERTIIEKKDAEEKE